jgi:hypothetical protein
VGKRASLPGADELFRATAGLRPVRRDEGEVEAPMPAIRPPRKASGRERHDEKITVYCTKQEVDALEWARLVLRAEYGISADRGRITREALIHALLDLAERGPDSILVQRLKRFA